jgi:Zinc carboxypeptidase
MKAGVQLRAPALLLAIVAIILALTALPAAGADVSTYPTQLVRIAAPSQVDRTRLANLGLDLTEHGGPGFVEAVLHSPDDEALLEAAGFSWKVTIPDLGIRQLENNKISEAYAAATVTSPLPSGRDTYRTLADYESELHALSAANPSFVRLLTLAPQSLEGRDIFGVEISDNIAATGDGKPVFLMLGLHHAREWPSGENSMEFAYDLVKGYKAGNTRIKGLLQKTRVIVVPVVNVDGFEQSRKWGDLVDTREIDEGGTVTILGNPGNAYKRKNCRVADGVPGAPGACEATSPGGYGIGVDLNRNYGGLWGGPGASDLAADPTYRGAGPFSEPETEAIRRLISSRQVTTLITNHTFSNLVLRPPGVRATGETSDEPAMAALGARMAAQNGYRNIRGWQLYDTTGTTEDWSYNATAGFGYTFEIGGVEFHPPFPEVVKEYLGAGPFAGKGNREAYLIALENAANPKAHSVISGSAPKGAVLHLTKEFTTKATTGAGVRDKLDSVLVVPTTGKYTWHVNPSTRGEVLEHQVRVLADTPSREEVIQRGPIVWTIGDSVEVPFKLPETDAGALKVKLDWPTPDDLDLVIYQVTAGGRVEVGSSGNQPGEKEEALIELPEPGDYIFHVDNFASVSTSFTITAGVYNVDHVESTGGGVTESYRLTCARPDGTVLETAWLTIGRGASATANLKTCAKRFAG